MVGPVEVGFGAVLAAGSIVRKDVPENALVATSGRSVRIKGFDRRRRGSVRRAFATTAKLVATLHSLDAWYRTVRIPHASGRERALLTSARSQIQAQARERAKRLSRVVSVLGERDARKGSARRKSIAREHRHLVAIWGELRDLLEKPVAPGAPPPDFLEGYRQARQSGDRHLDAVRAAPGAQATAKWLNGMVDGVTLRTQALLEAG